MNHQKNFFMKPLFNLKSLPPSHSDNDEVFPCLLSSDDIYKLYMGYRRFSNLCFRKYLRKDDYDKLVSSVECDRMADSLYYLYISILHDHDKTK